MSKPPENNIPTVSGPDYPMDDGSGSLPVINGYTPRPKHTTGIVLAKQRPTATFTDRSQQLAGG